MMQRINEALSLMLLLCTSPLFRNDTHCRFVSVGEQWYHLKTVKNSFIKSSKIKWKSETIVRENLLFARCSFIFMSFLFFLCLLLLIFISISLYKFNLHLLKGKYFLIFTQDFFHLISSFLLFFGKSSNLQKNDMITICLTCLFLKVSLA